MLLALLYLLLFPAAVTISATCLDELKAAKRYAAILLALFLLTTLALVTYAFAPLWFQVLLLVLLLVGFRRFSPLFLYKWLAGPLAVLIPFITGPLALWSAACLILATIMAAILFANGVKKKTKWYKAVQAGFMWLAPVYVFLALFSWLFLTFL
ncbi:hypothetical protein GOV07_03080 [Candidatus Woesearchaeota archaeon]|nr:hypothetical protein [Candidatus Woesearchaeota archaeon]